MQIKPLTKAIIMLTNKCNLMCPYCFETRTPEDMSFEIAEQAIDFLQSNCQKQQSPYVTFFGGEPLLQFDNIIIPLVEKYNTPIYSMVTNGTLLTEDRLKFLSKHNVSFMLSFDGPQSIQESQRPMGHNKSSYNTIMSLWPLIQQYEVCHTIRSTLTKDSLNELYNTIMFIKELNVSNLRIFPNDWELWTEEDRQMLQRQLQKYEEYLINSFRDNKEPFIFYNYGHAFCELYISNIVQERRMIKKCLPSYRCGIGIAGSCSIAPNGDIYGCHRISPLTHNSDWYLGDIWQGIDNKKVEKLLSYYNKDIIGNDWCASCPRDKICECGCMSNNLIITGNVNQTPTTYCIWNQELFYSAYRVATILGNEENTLFKQCFVRWCQRGI